jgi:hypothetical protein
MVKSHAEMHTNPRREVARFSESPYVELNNKTHRSMDGKGVACAVASVIVFRAQPFVG